MTAEGVETPSDVVGIWPDLHSFVSELHNIPEASPDLVMEAAAFYSRARRLASRAVVDRAQDIIAVRDSNFLQRQTRVAPYAAAVSDKCSQAKLKIMWRQSAADVKPQAAADSTSLPVHVPELKDSKLQGLFSLLVKHVLDLSSLGIPPAEQHSQQSCQLIMKGASSASAAYIATATSSLRRWIRFASERQLSVVAPAPAELAAFFREVALGGPTAAASVYQSLSWLDKKFGIGWPLQHFLVCPYKLLSSGHASKQAKELEPWEFLNLVALAEELTGPCRTVAAFVLQSAVSCIRFAHVQRSRLIAVHAGWLEYECSMGKSRQGGRRPPYRWACPEVCRGSFSLVETLQQFHEEVAHPKATFLWPAIQLSSEHLWQILEETPFRTNRQMSRSRFMECFRGLLTRAGLHPSKAHTAHYNRLRRFMPTAAMVFQCSAADAQAVGSWTENVQGSKAPTNKITMAVHYAGERVARSAKVKLDLIAKMWRIYRTKAGDYPSQGKLLEPDSWTWEAINRSRVASAEVASAEVAVLSPARAPGTEGSSSSSESEAASSTASVPGVVDCADLEWFQQRDKVHLSRERNEEQRYVPWCREQPFHQDPTQTGVGLPFTEVSKYCSKCLSRAPVGITQSIKDLAA